MLSIVTLGPAATDAAAVASKHADEVRLVGSFRAAMETACLEDAGALVPCGYLRRTDHSVDETWVDLHFEFSDRLGISACWTHPTKPMCLAVNDQSHHGSVVVHPATKWFADRLAPDKRPHYVATKTQAAQLCAAGEFDMCIASLDVVEASPSLRVVTTFTPEMVWVLYIRR